MMLNISYNTYLNDNKLIDALAYSAIAHNKENFKVFKNIINNFKKKKYYFLSMSFIKHLDDGYMKL